MSKITKLFLIFLCIVSSSTIFPMDPPDSKLHEQPPQKKMKVDSTQDSTSVSDESIEPPRKRQKTMFSEQQILDALKQNNQNIVNAWMKERFLGKGAQPIHTAALNGYLTIVKWLVEHDANISAQNNNGEQPIHFATRNGHLAIVKLLGAHGADVNAQDQSGCQPIHDAAFKGYLAIVEWLIAHGADVNATNSDDEEPIHLAAREGYLTLIKWLVDHGADVNAQNEIGIQPIHEAAGNGHLAIVKLLAAHGVDINATDSLGEEPIHWAAANGHLAIVKLLAANGADVNATNSDDEEPIHLAVQGGHLEIIKWLVAHGADVYAEDIRDQQPIHYAAINGYFEIVEWLIINCADVNARDMYGCQPIHYAAINGYFEIVKWLVAHGGDVRAQADCRSQPIHSAAQSNNLSLVEWLISHGADINAQEEDGTQAIHYAARRGHIALFKCFLLNGASIHQLSSSYIQSVPFSQRIAPFLQHIETALHSSEIEKIDTELLPYVLVQLVIHNDIEKIDAILKSHKNNISPEIFQHLILLFTRNFIAWLSNTNTTISHQNLHVRFQLLMKLLPYGSPKQALLFLNQQRYRISSPKSKAATAPLYHLLLNSSRLRLFDLALFNLTRREIPYQQIDQEIQRLPIDIVEVLFQIRNLSSESQFNLLRESIQNYNPRTFNILFGLCRSTLAQLHILNLLHFVATNDLPQLNTQAITNIITTLISAGENPSTRAVDQTPLLGWLHSMVQQDLLIDTIIDAQISQRRQLLINLLQGNVSENAQTETDPAPQLQIPNVNQLRGTSRGFFDPPVSMID